MSAQILNIFFLLYIFLLVPLVCNSNSKRLVFRVDLIVFNLRFLCIYFFSFSIVTKTMAKTTICDDNNEDETKKNKRRSVPFLSSPNSQKKSIEDNVSRMFHIFFSQPAFDKNCLSAFANLAQPYFVDFYVY